MYDEVVRLAQSGFKEIVLTGIHIASYGKDLKDTNLLELIGLIHSVEGIQRIRLGSIEPTLLTQEFINSIKDLHKVCQHYHISLQSGCDETLKRMNRKYTTGEYKAIVDQLRKAMPDVAITTDIMVGFPGETQDEFDNTCEFVRDIQFSKVHVFQYSPREGTPAATFESQVSPDEKERRSKFLIELARSLEEQYMGRFSGRIEKVLFEEKSHQFKGFYEGYNEHYVKVAAKGSDELEGNIFNVKLDSIDIENGIMFGEVVK